MAQSTANLDILPPAYNHHLQNSTYTRDEGLLVLPVAGPDGTPPRVIKVCAAIGFKNVRFDTSKRAIPPLIPAIEDTVNNDLILNSILNIPLPTIGGTSQNQYDYSVNGSYTYVQWGPRTDTGPTYGPRDSDSQFQTGRYPFIPVILNAMIWASYTTPSYFTPSAYDADYTFFPQEGPNPAGIPWEYTDGSSPELNPPYNMMALPVGTDSSSDIDITNPLTVYWDTTIGPSFFSAILIT